MRRRQRDGMARQNAGVKNPPMNSPHHNLGNHPTNSTLLASSVPPPGGRIEICHVLVPSANGFVIVTKEALAKLRGQREFLEF
jgi:hypothetical protein